MSFHTSRTLSHYGAFSAFGVAPQIFVGGPDFIGGDDQGVFYGANTGFTQGAKNQGYTWIPADQTLRKRAGDKWAELSESDVSDKDIAWKEAMGRKLGTLLQSFYAAVGNHSMLGYSADATQSIITIGDQLKAELRKIAAYRVTHITYEEEPRQETQTVREQPTQTVVRETSSALTSQSPSGRSASPYDEPEEQKSNTLLYAGIGAGVLLLGVLLLRRPRAAATAGYRRRRRRR